MSKTVFLGDFSIRLGTKEQRDNVRIGLLDPPFKRRRSPLDIDRAEIVREGNIQRDDDLMRG